MMLFICQTISFMREFDNNILLQVMFGPQNVNMSRIEQKLDVHIELRGNAVTVYGQIGLVEVASSVLDTLYDRLRRGQTVGIDDVDAAVHMSRHSMARLEPNDALVLRTSKRHVVPRAPAQAAYLQAMRDNELVFGLGPAGTGKTYLAVAMAVSMMLLGKIDRLILSRPAVEAGERLGFLPGDLHEKIDPYFRPLYDALYDMLPGEQVMKRLGIGNIEVAPLAFMRGRTLANAFVILDEAQNTTPMQMKMFLTRLGENARMVVTGDLSQVDLLIGMPSGLHEAVRILGEVDGVAFVCFTDQDVVRHELVSRIVRAYQDDDESHRDIPEALG
ncbi:Phosphate starvation-inducible protein PhoH, predicted ATPase [invertebrate metagenome]|uniref:PhoH-like protein n=1 Tax=invertebrate metagenome TaxID=1711999 RepID=A0A484H713_9ZZZZ